MTFRSDPAPMRGRVDLPMQKLIHITAPHLVAPRQTLYGLDPAARLGSVLADVAATHSDAGAVLITGDLADAGQPTAYETLHDLVDNFPIPVHLTLGNHDSRPGFQMVFGGDGFVHSSIDLGRWRVILVDTKDETSVHGSLDGDRLDWLDQQLTAAANRPVLLAMHYPPHDLHVPNFAAFGLKDPKALHALIARHGNVRQMLFGHMHLNVSGMLFGIPFSVNRGTAQHIALDLGQRGKPAFVAGQPSFAIVLLDVDEAVVHHIDGLSNLPMLRPADPK